MLMTSTRSIAACRVAGGRYAACVAAVVGRVDADFDGRSHDVTTRTRHGMSHHPRQTFMSPKVPAAGTAAKSSGAVDPFRALWTPPPSASIMTARHRAALVAQLDRASVFGTEG